MDTVDVGPKDIVLQSLHRCDGDRGFLERFYQRFMDASPVVREKFAHTEMHRQRRMLRHSLELMARATAGEPEGIRELHERTETHSRANLDIAPPLYDLWLEALIATAREADPDWTSAVESAWRDVLGLAIRHMTTRYDI